MPSRVLSFDTAAAVANGTFGQGRDFPIVPAGNRCLQITVNLLPPGAAGFMGMRAGKSGDVVTLSREGVSFMMTGDDTLGGLFAVWLGNGSGNPAGVVEFVLVAPDDGGADT